MPDKNNQKDDQIIATIYNIKNNKYANNIIIINKPERTAFGCELTTSFLRSNGLLLLLVLMLFRLLLCELFDE